MSETIIDKNALVQFKEDMQRYSIYVSRKRTTPSILDGLKPVHRRIIYGMLSIAHATSAATKVKSSSIVGQVMDKFHPHGDAAIYGSIKPLTNWFECKIPLIDGHGVFGTFQGSEAAAARYTLASLSAFTMECVVGGLIQNRNAVDWEMSYNDVPEPEYLPVALPLLLIEGSFSIGVGMKVDIPTHNLGEVIDQTIRLIYDANAPIELVPDQCMPCYIQKTDFKKICNLGYGSYKVRAIIDIEEYKGSQALVIKSTPNLTFLDTITDRIEELVANNTIVNIKEAFDESNTKQLRYVIVLKKGADPNFVREMIYKSTEMEQNCRVNFEVLDGITPIRVSYREYILRWIEFRKLTKFRIYCNELRRIQTRIHERDAYIKLLQSGDIDNIITIIRKQKTTDDTYLIEYLVKKISITDLQAKFILGSDLRKLTIGYLEKYKQEASELVLQEQEVMNKIVNENILIDEIISELQYFKKKYGKPRICPIVTKFNESDVPQGEVRIIITENNLIKKIPTNQAWGNFKYGDSPKKIIKVDNTENILIFDEIGRVFKLPVAKVPFTDKNSPGLDIRTLIKGLTANINTVIRESLIEDLESKVLKSYMVVITNNGYMKRMDLGDFLNIPPSGIIYTKTEKDDMVKDIIIVGNKADIVVYSDKKALRMTLDNVSYLKRNTRGTKAMNSVNHIDGISIIRPHSTDIVVITECGRINRFSVGGLSYQDRNKNGGSVIKLTKTDKIKAIFGLIESDVIKITAKNLITEIKVSDIPVGSSIGNGEKMIPLKTGDLIVRCDIIREQHK